MQQKNKEMKTSTVYSIMNSFNKAGNITARSILFFMLLSIVSISHLFAQSGPGITARFANPEFLPADNLYCVDVEFFTDTEGTELFGMNARFFVDHDLFDFLAFSDFQGGYGVAPDGIGVVTSTGDGNFFSFGGDALFINQAIEKVDDGATPIPLSQSEWTYLFKACFILKDDAYLGLDLFCPSIVWDLRQGADNGFPAGSDGLVMTVVNDESGGCILASELVEQFNWEYEISPIGNVFGAPVTDPDLLACTSTRSIPLPSWALALLGVLMMVFVLIRRNY